VALENSFVLEYWLAMPDKNDSDIFDVETQLKSLAESENLSKWLSDVDVSKQIADWLVDEHGFKRWQVMIGLRLITPLILGCGKAAGKIMTDVMKNRLISKINDFAWAKEFIDRLDDLRTKTGQRIQAEEDLKGRLQGDINRAKGDKQYRKELALDLQAAFEQLDTLDDMQVKLDFIKGLLKPQPQFKSVYESDDERSRFIYRSQYIPFVGRKKELDMLQKFLNSDKMFCWHALVGPGGVGKSRLSLEFCLRNGVAYRAGILRNLKFDFENWIPSQPTLLVIDYGSKDEERLREILGQLSDRDFDFGVRVLVLDRDSSGHKIGDLYDDDDFRHTRFVDSHYLLNKSDENVAKGILEFFYSEEGKQKPESWSDHLSELHEIDASMRPLFAAYYADARAKGGCGREYSRKSLLYSVIKREENKFWTPCGVTEADKALLALATIVDGISTADDLTLPECVTSLKKLAEDKDRFKALNCKVVQDSNETKINQIISSWEPDLVGELFVLEFLKDDEDTGLNKYRRDILKTAWSAAPFDTAIFLNRARQDYFDHANFSQLSGKTESLSKFSASAWALLAVNLIDDYGKAQELDKALSLYADLQSLASSDLSTPDIVLAQANGAFNLINNYGKAQEFDKALSLYADLQSLASSDLSTPGIVFRQAMGAFTLINAYWEAQELDKALPLYADLQSLASFDLFTSAIVLQQARAACSLCFLFQQAEQPEKAEQYLTVFREVCKKYPDSPEFMELSGQFDSFLQKLKTTS
jgi:hypothetical protein